MKSLKDNIIYNTILQFFNIIFPFITGAYISRTLGAKNLGSINFVQSVISLIIVVVSLGIPTYGIREIAKNRDNQNEINRIFSELIIIRSLVTLLIIVFYYTIIFFIPQLKSQNELFFIMGIGIFLNLFNIDWFFNGIEDYKMITIRNVIIKILTFIIIIIFVKRESNYKLYAFILVLSQGLSNIWSYKYSNKFVKIIFKGLDYISHIKKLKFFLMSSLIVSIYTIINTIYLGVWGTSNDVAYFVRARQLQGIGLVLTSSISTVLIPRISYYYYNDKEKYYDLLSKSLNYNYIISIPLGLGLFLLSDSINIFIGGNEFINASLPLKILAPLVIIISLGTWSYLQIMIPIGEEKLGTLIQILMAIVNICLNILLIPKYSYIGAAISLLITEITGPFVSFYFLKKKIKFILITNSLKKYLISTLLMGFFIIILKSRIEGLLLLLLSGIIGGCIYLLSLILMKEKIIYIFYKKLYEKIRRNYEKNNGD